MCTCGINTSLPHHPLHLGGGHLLHLPLPSLLLLPLDLLLHLRRRTPLLLAHHPALRQPLGALLPLAPLRPVVAAIAHRQPPLLIHLLPLDVLLGHARVPQALRARLHRLAGRHALAHDMGRLRTQRHARALQRSGIDVGDQPRRLGQIRQQVGRDVRGLLDAPGGDQAGDGGPVVGVLVVQALEDGAGLREVRGVVRVEQRGARGDHEGFGRLLCLRAPVLCCGGELGFRGARAGLRGVQGDEGGDETRGEAHV